MTDRVADNMKHYVRMCEMLGQAPSGARRLVKIDENGRVETTAILNAGDIELGAVEIKDHDSNLRMDVSLPGALYGHGAHVLPLVDGGGRAQAGITGAGVIDLATQRVNLANNDLAVLALQIIDDWDAVHGAAASTDGPQAMGAYHAVPPAVGDGNAVRTQSDAYGHQEGAAHNRLLGADQGLEVAPPTYDKEAGVARASAALGAGYDAAPTEEVTGGRKWVLYSIAYTRGAVNGSIQVKIERCITESSADQWPQTSVISTGAVVPGADTNSPMQEEEFEFQSTGLAIDYFCLVIPTYGCHKIRIAARESSGLAVGTAAIVRVQSNN